MSAIDMRSGNHFSDNNQKILSAYADSKYTKLTGMQDEATQAGLWQIIKGYLPFISSQTVGQNFGWAMMRVHGTEVSNRAIGAVVRRAMGPGMVARAAVVPTAEIARLVLNPVTLPILEFVGMTVGGIAFPAAVAAVQAVAQRIIQRSDRDPLEEFENLDVLLQRDAEGRVVDFLGKVYTEMDLSDIRETLIRYDVATRLLNSGSEEEYVGDETDLRERQITRALEGYVSLTERGITLQDGMVLEEDSEEFRTLELGIQQLCGKNPMGKEKRIKALIKLLARHVRVMTPEELDQMRRRQEVERPVSSPPVPMLLSISTQ